MHSELNDYYLYHLKGAGKMPESVYVNYGGGRIVLTPIERASKWLTIKCRVCGEPATHLQAMGATKDLCDECFGKE